MIMHAVVILLVVINILHISIIVKFYVKTLALAGQLEKFNEFIRRYYTDPDCNPDSFEMIQLAPIKGRGTKQIPRIGG